MKWPYIVIALAFALPFWGILHYLATRPKPYICHKCRKPLDGEEVHYVKRGCLEDLDWDMYCDECYCGQPEYTFF